MALAADAAARGTQRVRVKLVEAKQGFVLLPWRAVIERWIAWQGRFRRLARDDERRLGTLARPRSVAFVSHE